MWAYQSRILFSLHMYRYPISLALMHQSSFIAHACHCLGIILLLYWAMRWCQGVRYSPSTIWEMKQIFNWWTSLSLTMIQFFLFLPILPMQLLLVLSLPICLVGSEKTLVCNCTKWVKSFCLLCHPCTMDTLWQRKWDCVAHPFS